MQALFTGWRWLPSAGLSIIVSLAAFVAAPPTYAASDYLTTWIIDAYPDSQTDEGAGTGNDRCRICHGTGTSNLNAYGAAFCAQSGTTQP